MAAVDRRTADRGRRVTRSRAWVAGLALLGAAACNEAKADVEPLPPLRRPTIEERAGLPTIAGRWLFTGFEYSVVDTARVRDQMYRLVPPGEFQIATQRLDSIAGRYVREGVAFPLSGEVRRDGIFAFVAFEPGGAGQFVSGRVAKDTLWIELTGFPSAASWPPGTRVALVRNPKGPPFVRLRGYVPPPPPPVDSTKQGETSPAAAPAPAPPPVETRPRETAPPPPPPPPAPPVYVPPDTFNPNAPPPDTPRTTPPPRRGRRQRDTTQTQPPPLPPPDTPVPQMPRDTIRLNPPAR